MSLTHEQVLHIHEFLKEKGYIQERVKGEWNPHCIAGYRNYVISLNNPTLSPYVPLRVEETPKEMQYYLRNVDSITPVSLNEPELEQEPEELSESVDTEKSIEVEVEGTDSTLLSDAEEVEEVTEGVEGVEVEVEEQGLQKEIDFKSKLLKVKEHLEKGVSFKFR